MARPWTVAIGREYSTVAGERKTDWVRIGAAWPHKSGDGGFTIELYALPAASQDNHGAIRTKLELFPPRTDTRPQDGGGQPQASDDFNDDIPF